MQMFNYIKMSVKSGGIGWFNTCQNDQKFVKKYLMNDM